MCVWWGASQESLVRIHVNMPVSACTCVCMQRCRGMSMPTCVRARNSFGGTPQKVVTVGIWWRGEERVGDTLFTVRTFQLFRFLPCLRVTSCKKIFLKQPQFYYKLVWAVL